MGDVWLAKIHEALPGRSLLRGYGEQLSALSPQQQAKSLMIFPSALTSPLLFSPATAYIHILDFILSSGAHRGPVAKSLSVLDLVIEIRQHTWNQERASESLESNLSSSQLRSLDRAPWKLALSHMLRLGEYEHIHRGHIPAMSMLCSNMFLARCGQWGEYSSQQLSTPSKVMAELLARLQSSDFFSDQDSELLLKRCQELQDLTAKLEVYLQDKGYLSQECFYYEGWCELKEVLKTSPAAQKSFKEYLESFVRIDFLGFVAASPIERWLFEELSQYAHVHFHVLKTPTLSLSSPHVNLGEGEEEKKFQRLWLGKEIPSWNKLTVVASSHEKASFSEPQRFLASLPTAESEWQRALECAYDFVASGIPSHKVAILLPRGGAYLYFAHECEIGLQKRGLLNLQLSLPLTLASCGLGSVIKAFSVFMRSSKDLRDFYELMITPWLWDELKERFVKKRLPKISTSFPKSLIGHLKECLSDLISKISSYPDEARLYWHKLLGLNVEVLSTKQKSYLLAWEFAVFSYSELRELGVLDFVRLSPTLKKFFYSSLISSTSPPHPTPPHRDSFSHIFSSYHKLLQALSEGVSERFFASSPGVFYSPESLQEVLSELFEDLGRVFDHNTYEVSHGEWLDFLLSVLPEYTLKTPEEPLSGVQVLSWHKGLMLPFEAVVVCGCEQGGLHPSKSNLEELMSLYWLKKMEFCPPYTEADLEYLSFELLWHSIPHQIYLYTRGDLQKTPALFLAERLSLAEVVAGGYLWPSQREAQQASFLARFSAGSSLWSSQRVWDYRKSPRAHEVGLGPSRGEDSLLSSISPSSLEKLIHCPYSFFLSKRGIRKGNVIESPDALHLGQWLHKLMEIFFQGLNLESSSSSTAVVLEPLRKSDHKVQTFIDRFKTITEVMVQYFPGSFLKSSVYYELLSWRCEHLGRWFFTLFAEAGWPLEIAAEEDLKEKSFLFPPTEDRSSLDPETQSAVLSGKIDLRIEMADFSLIIDYKTRYLPQKSDIRRGFKPQLLLYSYSLQRPLEEMILVYLSLLGEPLTLMYLPSCFQGTPLQQLFLGDPTTSKNSKKSSVFKYVEDFSETRSLLETRYLQRLQEIKEQGSFRAEKGLHCDLCSYRGLCRIDDPDYSPLQS